MIRAMRSHRALHAVLLVLALLFSQWAVAAHACAVASGVASVKASSAGHAPCCPQPAAPNTCEQHCAYGDATVDHAKPLPALDVTLGPALAVPIAEPARLRPRLDRPPAVAPDPPPAIRFSVLRI